MSKHEPHHQESPRPHRPPVASSPPTAPALRPRRWPGAKPAVPASRAVVRVPDAA